MKTSFGRMWGAVIIIGIFTAVGLLSALLGDGIWDMASAVTLGVPVVVAGWFGFAKRSNVDHYEAKKKQRERRHGPGNL
jgi:hypothetical protein